METPQTIEDSILKDCEYNVFPFVGHHLSYFFNHLENHIYFNHPRYESAVKEFQEQCASLTKKWTEGKTPEQQKFITDTFEKVILGYTKDYLNKNATDGEQLVYNYPMMKKLKAFQSLKVAPHQTATLVLKEKEEKKADGTIQKTWNSIKETGETFFNGLFPYKSRQLVENVALVAEFLLDCLFGGVKGLINGIKSDVKEEIQKTE
ncbi:hypothetical protein FACS1894199_02770 [Bacteroidia bacterium]|nr:hypothetical protein FACS1894199_02770 [Bacteroidia bacterium]